MVPYNFTLFSLFFLHRWGKRVRGYTIVLLLITMEEKSVGYIFFLHLSDGRKECGVHCFTPMKRK